MSVYNKLKSTKKDSEILKLLFKYLPCFLKGILCIVIGILVLSFSYYKMSDHSIVIYYMCYLFLVLGGFVSGNSSHKKIGGRGIVAGSLGALPVALFFYIFLLIFSFKVLTIYSLICPLMCVIGGAIGGIISSNTKKRY